MKPRHALHLAFCASGAAALVYEVLWMRRFTVLLGATAPATAATLGALFAGIGLGSALFGRAVARARRPLLWFGLLEAGIAAGALAVEPLLATADWFPSLSLAGRMALAMAALLPPAILMGGSLPVLAQALDRDREGLGVHGGGLYALNTLGAAVGSLAVPLLLLPALGARRSSWIAVAVSLAVAALAVALDVSAPRSSAEPRAIVQPGPSPGLPWPLLVAAFVSGAAALGLELLWTRMLALVHENSIYSFATVVAVFLAGIGAGAAGGRMLLRRGTAPRKIAAVGWIGSGVWVVITPGLFWALTSGLRYTSGSRGLVHHEIEIAGLALATMLPATVLAGAVLPALMELAGHVAAGGSSGRALGTLLCANTLGAVVGPLGALFLAGPALGLWWSLVAAGLVQIVAGEAVLHGWPRRKRRPARLVGYAAGAAVFVLVQPGALPRVRLEPAQRLIDLREGPFGTVAVVEEDGERRMMLNNYYVIGGTASTGEERLQAHLPLLLHAAPRRVGLLGLGTGITASGALYHPVDEVVAMELVPEVVEAAREQFAVANSGVLADPRVRVVVTDARTYLRSSRERFDVLVGDLVVPWRRGESALYTRESFESARAALAPAGIFCQWLPLYQLSRREFESIAASFLDVFPESLLWRGDFRAGESAVALVGLTGAAALEPAAIDARVRDYAEQRDPSNPMLSDPAGLWLYLAGSLSPADPALRAAPRSHDDRPIVELNSPATQFSGAFTRERLKAYFDELLERPLAGSPLERLDARHLAWRRAGADIWSASLLELQGRRAEADALGLAALATLPAPLRRAVRGGS